MYLVQSSKVLDWWIDKGTIGILHPWYGVYYVRHNVKWHADRSHKPVIWLKYKHFRSKKYIGTYAEELRLGIYARLKKVRRKHYWEKNFKMKMKYIFISHL